MPGWQRRAAQDTIVETGPDMSRFPAGSQLGLMGRARPLDHQSAKRTGRSKARRGDRYLGAVTGETAVPAAPRPARAPATGGWPEGAARPKHASLPGTPS
jgi:hypothetical protein